ncbi:hypothetical protein [Rhizobacter fulvus]
MKALTLLAKGDCWHGGGPFASSKELWVNDSDGKGVFKDGRGIERTAPYPWHEQHGGECPGVSYVRLRLDGWTMKYTAPDSAGGMLTLFERRINTHWRLRKLAHVTVHQPVGKGCYFDEHQLFNARTEDVVALPNWEWAEVDGGRIVLAQSGRLIVGRFEGEGLRGEKSLIHWKIRSKSANGICCPACARSGRQ